MLLEKRRELHNPLLSQLLKNSDQLQWCSGSPTVSLCLSMWVTFLCSDSCSSFTNFVRNFNPCRRTLFGLPFVVVGVNSS